MKAAPMRADTVAQGSFRAVGFCKPVSSMVIWRLIGGLLGRRRAATEVDPGRVVEIELADGRDHRVVMRPGERLIFGRRITAIVVPPDE
jgi:hypothetical protein